MNYFLEESDVEIEIANTVDIRFFRLACDTGMRDGSIRTKISSVLCPHMEYSNQG